MNGVSRLPLVVPIVGCAAALALLTAAGIALVTYGETDPAGTEGHAIERLDRPVLEAAGPSPAPLRAAASPPQAVPRHQAADAAQIARTPPTLLAVAPRPVTPRQRDRIAALRHVRKVALLDGGAVRVAGTGLNLLAADPAEFRAWAPRAVAEQPAVWAALLRGELLAEAATVTRFGLILGAEYQIDGGPRLRVAASAPLGLPGVDGIVATRTGQRLGLTPGIALLIHSRAGTAATVGEGVRDVLGEGTQLFPLGAEAGTDPVAPSASPPPGTALVGRPDSYLELYRRAARLCPGLSWTVLAAIGQVESSHGRNNGPSSAGALGPMQFLPSTWRAYGVDGDGDGKADIWSAYDAVPAAARYLCAYGAGQGGEKLKKAIWFYNHSWEYVAKVLALADAYAKAYP